VLVYSTIFGGYDAPKPPRPHPAVTEWRLYTDDPQLYAPGWCVVVEPSSGHPRMRAKRRKCCPPTDEHFTLYLDGSIRLRDPELLSHALAILESGAPWAMYPHPERTTIVEELAASVPMPKYREHAARMAEQVSHYGSVDGLWACGILARDVRSPDVLAAGFDWLEECERWTYQDQLSLPVVLARHGVTPTAMTLGGLWGNPHFTVEPHQSDQ